MKRLNNRLFLFCGSVSTALFLVILPVGKVLAVARLQIQGKVVSLEMEKYSEKILVGLKDLQDQYKVTRGDTYQCLETALKTDRIISLTIDPKTMRVTKCILNF